MAAADLLGALVLSGILGVVGQGARTVVGLKKLYEENQSKEPSERDTFIASRLFISLFIGFISGVIAALSLGLTELANATTTSIDLLLGIAAAGYAGTDIIEAFVPKIGSGAKLNTTNAEPPPVPERVAQ